MKRNDGYLSAFLTFDGKKNDIFSTADGYIHLEPQFLPPWIDRDTSINADIHSFVSLVSRQSGRPNDGNCGAYLWTSNIKSKTENNTKQNRLTFCGHWSKKKRFKYPRYFLKNRQ